MDTLDSGLGGIFLGWVLAQLGFFIQRRRLLKGEASKAAYFLLIVLNEVAALATIKKSEDRGHEDRGQVLLFVVFEIILLTQL